MTRRLIQLMIACGTCLMPLQGSAADGEHPGEKPESPAAESKPAAPKSEPASDPRIDPLLDDLESADVKVRDRAQQDLIRIGPSAVAPLDARLADAPSPELVSRSKLIKEGITRAWRYWDPAGEKICGGFQAKLLPVDDVLTFKAGGPALLNLEVRNVSPDPRQLTDIRGFDLDLGLRALFESPFCDARLIVRRADGAEMPREAHAIVLGTDAPHVVTFKTGGNLLTPIRIDEGVKLPPGDYDVRVQYYGKSHKLIAGAFADLEVGPIRIKVTSDRDGEKTK